MTLHAIEGLHAWAKGQVRPGDPQAEHDTWSRRLAAATGLFVGLEESGLTQHHQTGRLAGWDFQRMCRSIVSNDTFGSDMSCTPDGFIYWYVWQMKNRGCLRWWFVPMQIKSNRIQSQSQSDPKSNRIWQLDRLGRLNSKGDIVTPLSTFLDGMFITIDGELHRAHDHFRFQDHAISRQLSM